MSSASVAVDTVVLDIDGTLIDSVYAHVWSWREAFRVHGVVVPAWKLHRAIGMGGDRLVGAVSNEGVEAAIGERRDGDGRDLRACLGREHRQHEQRRPQPHQGYIA